MLDRLATVQLDSVNVLARSHELVFFSRLGPYDREALSRWLWASREVFEYWGHEASLHPVARQPLLRWRMTEEHAWGGVASVARDNPAMVAAALDEISANGPVGMAELEVHRAAPRKGESWWGWGEGQAGRRAPVLGRGGDRRPPTLRPRLPAARAVVPARGAGGPDPDGGGGASRAPARRRPRHGVGTARDLADYYRLNVPRSAQLLQGLVDEGRLLPARVEGWGQPAFLHPARTCPAAGRAGTCCRRSTRWCGAGRTERLWGVRYRIEIYVPAAKRVHGYYVLPFLLGEDLVECVDLKADRKAGVLRVRAAWVEDRSSVRTAPGRDEVAAELAGELGTMAAWMGLAGGVAVEPAATWPPRCRRRRDRRRRPVTRPETNCAPRPVVAGRSAQFGWPA